MLRLHLTSSCLFLAACGAGRDVIPESHDVQGVVRDAGRGDEAGYEYIARRTLAVVGLAEGRGLDPEVSAKVTERLADSLEACVEDLSSKGRLVDGAVRVAARIAPDGTPEGLALKTPPGDAVKANALLCFVAPFKLTVFPAAAEDAPARGIAIEATWGLHVQGAGVLTVDGGGS